MDDSQARVILGYDLNLNANSEEILDAVEEAVFKQVTFFMRRAFLPVLAVKCIKRLHEIDFAAKALGLNYELDEVEFAEVGMVDQNDLLTLLSVYHSNESELKSKLVNTTKPLQAVSLYKKWIILFESFGQNYITIFNDLNVDRTNLNPNEIRITEAIEFNDLNRELNDLIYNNLALKEYTRLMKLIKNK